MKTLLLFCLAICAGASLHAQQPATAPSGPPPVLPPGPLLKPVPDNTRWTVISTGKQSEDAKPEEKAKGATVITGVKAGKMAHVAKMTKGVREDRWTDGTLVAIKAGANAPFFMTGGAVPGMPTPAAVAAENFAEIQKQGGKDYLIFRAKVLPIGAEVVQDLDNPNQDIEAMKVEATVVVDAETRLPVGAKEGDATMTYKYEPLPPGAQIIPAALQADMAKREQKVLEVMRMPARP